MKKMLDVENHIILDKIESWPDEFLLLIKNSEKELKGFLREEHRIDKLRNHDLLTRYFRPKNIYFERWCEIIDNLEVILEKYNIVGFHCTKLMDYEVSDIQNNGLNPLNKNFSNQRIEKLYRKGFISKDLKSELINKDELDDEYRKGRIFVFHCLSTLKDEWGLNRLFGYWGGESLYTYLKNTNELKSIGISCIILTSIKIKELDIHPQLSKRMVALYFEDNCYPHDTDSIIETNLNVIRVIRQEEKLFEDLTNIKDWKEEL